MSDVTLTQGEFNNGVKEKAIKAMRPYRNSIEFLLDTGDILIISKRVSPETFDTSDEMPLDVRLVSKNEEWEYS